MSRAEGIEEAVRHVRETIRTGRTVHQALRELEQRAAKLRAEAKVVAGSGFRWRR